MRGLLALVIIMGVLIVAGLIVVVVTIAMRLSGSARDTAAETAFETRDLPIPAGCQVMEMIAADDRLILRLGSGERCNQILVVDAASGRHLGTVRLVPE